MGGPAALVWFKRDLRVRDHAPLAQALHFENALGLVVIEPQWLHSPECDPRHVGFLLDCVAGLQRDLAARGLRLLVRSGDMPQVRNHCGASLPSPICSAMKRRARAGAIRATWPWPSGAAIKACNGLNRHRPAWCGACVRAPGGPADGPSA